MNSVMLRCCPLVPLLAFNFIIALVDYLSFIYNFTTILWMAVARNQQRQQFRRSPNCQCAPEPKCMHSAACDVCLSTLFGPLFIYSSAWYICIYCFLSGAFTVRLSSFSTHCTITIEFYFCYDSVMILCPRLDFSVRRLTRRVFMVSISKNRIKNLDSVPSKGYCKHFYIV